MRGQKAGIMNWKTEGHTSCLMVSRWESHSGAGRSDMVSRPVLYAEHWQKIEQGQDSNPDHLPEGYKVKVDIQLPISRETTGNHLASDTKEQIE